MNRTLYTYDVILHTRRIYYMTQGLAWLFSMFVRVFYRALPLNVSLLGKSWSIPPRIFA
jgi:hypothetical protein